MLVFSIENILEDEHLVQVNLDTLIISKLIYKTLHYRLMYVGPDRVLKAAKDAGILISRAEALEYHCKLYTLSKSTYVISYILLAPTTRYFIEIYVNIIKHKPLSINGYKYTIHLLDRYFNYQWIFFIKTKKAIFEKFVEILTFLKNQINLKIHIIYLDNGIKFYPIELATFVIEKSIHLKPIILGTSNQNGPIERTGKTIINQVYTSFIINGLPEGHWPYTEETTVYIINFTLFSVNPDSINLYKCWAYKINLSIEYIKPSIRMFFI